MAGLLWLSPSPLSHLHYVLISHTCSLSGISTYASALERLFARLLVVFMWMYSNSSSHLLVIDNLIFDLCSVPDPEAAWSCVLPLGINLGLLLSAWVFVALYWVLLQIPDKWGILPKSASQISLNSSHSGWIPHWRRPQLKITHAQWMPPMNVSETHPPSIKPTLTISNFSIDPRHSASWL